MDWNIRGFSYNDYKNYSNYPKAWNGTDGSRTDAVSGVTGARALDFPGRTGERAGGIDPAQTTNPGKKTGAVTDPRQAQKGAAIDPDQEKKPGRRSSPAECETCKKRKYQDGSDECNVSFKSAAHVSPNAAGAAVRAHENMHVRNAYKKAAEKNGKVLSATVAIHTAVCPECGRVYVSGGVTHTAIRYGDTHNPYQQDRMAQDHDRMAGANFTTGM